MIQRSLTPLAELLHRALKAQMHYAQDHPRAVQSVEAVHQLLQELLRKRSPIILTSSGAQLWYQGRAVEGAPNATATARLAMTSTATSGGRVI